MGKRPGYRREKPAYLLKFEDDQFDGLEVTARSLPLGEFFTLQRLQAQASDDADAAEQVVRKLGGVLIGWNLESDDGKPVPCEFAVCRESGKPGKPGEPCSARNAHTDSDDELCEYDGLVDQDLPFVLAILSAWMEAMASVPNRSPGNSSGGGTSLEPSIPMEPA